MTASRELLAQLTREVLSAWQRGWQPSELVRVIRRQTTARHAAVVVDAIAAQMREYAAATVDDRWKAQLADLDAVVDWPSDDELLAWWSDREGLPEQQIAAIAARTALYLHRLPQMPFTGPLPGEHHPSPTATAAEGRPGQGPTGHAGQGPTGQGPTGQGPTGQGWAGRSRPGEGQASQGRAGVASEADAGAAKRADERMLARVRALLAKAESTTFPEEAEAYTAKAQELMARHSIDEALLSARTGARHGPGIRRIPVDNPYEAPKTLLLQAVAGANRCRCVWAKEFGLATIMGFPTDLDAVELLFTSLLVQAVRAMTVHQTTSASFRRAFLTAYAVRIGQRLDEATQRAEESAGSALLPVLSKRADDVEARFREVFPQTRRQTVNVSNGHGWAEGRAAADRADLHGRAAVRSQSAKSPAGRA
jgi:hypothetical protein